jgi:excisionase family DNA binding protein
VSLLDSFSDDARAELEAFIAAEVERQLRERALLTVDEAAAKIGLTPKAVRHKISRGQIAAIKVGGRVLIPLSELTGA